jgi:hypothetical protein
MPETYIIRPTKRAANERGVPRAAQIIRARVATGFVGNLERVSACSTIIIIDDDEGGSQAASIQRVTQVPALEGQAKPRLRIAFGTPRDLTPAEQRMSEAITWSSSNVRYLTIP